MKPTVECNVCFKRGDGEWAGWHKQVIGHNDFCLLYGEDDEPPSKNGKSPFKLSLSGIRDLCCVGTGRWGNPQSHYPFRSLVHLCVSR